MSKHADQTGQAKSTAASVREHDRRKHDSEYKKGVVMGTIEEARSWLRAVNPGKAEEAREKLFKAKDWLDKAFEQMKDGWGGFNAATEIFNGVIMTQSGRLTREDREELWETLKSVKQEMAHVRTQVFSANHGRVKSMADDAYNTACSGDPYEVIKGMKALRQAVNAAFLPRDQRTLLHEELDRAWQKAQERVAERREERSDRLRGHLDRWAGIIEKHESFIAKVEAEIDDLEEKAENARTEEFAETVRGWIEDKREKIRGAQGRIDELDDKMEAVREKLGGSR